MASQLLFYYFIFCLNVFPWDFVVAKSILPYLPVKEQMCSSEVRRLIFRKEAQFEPILIK